MKSEFSVVRCNAENLPDNIIGAAVLVEHKKVVHAGIFIRYNGDSKLFHFTGEEVLLGEFDDKEIYFFNDFPFISAALAPSFLAHCEIVMKEASPKFGYFYVDSFYDAAGKFLSPGEFPEYMTCVGFCLNFLKYYNNGTNIFEIEDWDSSGLDKSEEYIHKFIDKVKVQHPTLDVDSFKKGIRRIWPTEYFSSTYNASIPIRKAFIDGIIADVTKTLLSEERA